MMPETYKEFRIREAYNPYTRHSISWRIIMARVCDLCGKGTTFGNSVPRKGMPKKEGGAGQHVVKRIKRNFKPNLVQLKARYQGTVQNMKICTSCLKAGKVEKVL